MLQFVKQYIYFLITEIKLKIVQIMYFYIVMKTCHTLVNYSSLNTTLNTGLPVTMKNLGKGLLYQARNFWVSNGKVETHDSINEVYVSSSDELVIHNVLLSCVTILPNPTLELKQTRGDSFIGLFKSLLSS